MESNHLQVPYIIADGPDGLANALETLQEVIQSKPALVSRDFYILYRLGNQKSFIKVDFSQQPIQFWYYDLLGRPITMLVKNTIATFLWEKCGEKERAVKMLANKEEV